MPQILPDDEIAGGINSLNSKQRKVFNVIHKWTKEYAKYNIHNVKPIHIFLLGSGDTGKSHLVKVIYNAISKILLYQGPEKSRVLLLSPTGISAVYIGGITIHSGLSFKSGIRLLDLNDALAALRNKILEVKLLFIDKLSMV